VSYDPAGNQITLPWRTFTYDAENRLIAATEPNMAAINYVYDGEGKRVQKTVGGLITTYVYDAFGQLAAEYAMQPPASGLQYLTADPLGSTRLVTDASGNAVRRSTVTDGTAPSNSQRADLDDQLPPCLALDHAHLPVTGMCSKSRCARSGTSRSLMRPRKKAAFCDAGPEAKPCKYRMRMGFSSMARASRNFLPRRVARVRVFWYANQAAKN